MFGLLKKVIITGGTGGLGRQIERRFVLGACEVTKLGSADLDLNDSSEIKSYFAKVKCDLLICAAGIIRDQPILRMQESDWDHVFQINYSAARLCAEAVIPRMIHHGRGHVIFISSYAAIHPTIGQAAYATAKSALLGLTKDLALIYGCKNIRVNAVLPGFLETSMTEAMSLKRKETVKTLHSLERFNTPEHAADFIYFLDSCLPNTSGQIFHLDSRP